MATNCADNTEVWKSRPWRYEPDLTGVGPQDSTLFSGQKSVKFLHFRSFFYFFRDSCSYGHARAKTRWCVDRPAGEEGKILKNKRKKNLHSCKNRSKMDHNKKRSFSAKHSHRSWGDLETKQKWHEKKIIKTNITMGNKNVDFLWNIFLPLRA